MICPICETETSLLFPFGSAHACRNCKDKPLPVLPLPKVEKTYGLVFDPAQGRKVFRGRDKSFPPLFSLWRRSPPWHPDWVFEGFEDCALICVGPSANDEWYWEDDHTLDTWIFFRSREQWDHAWRLARIIARDGYGRVNWTCQGHGEVLAYKLPFRETLIVNEGMQKRVLDFDWRVREGIDKVEVAVYTHPAWDCELFMPTDGTGGKPEQYLGDAEPSELTLDRKLVMSAADLRCMGEFEG